MTPNSEVQPTTMRKKCALAAFSGVLLWAIFFWKFLPYDVRDRSDLLPWWTLPCLTFLVALLLTWPRAQHRILIPFALLGGFLAPHAVLVVVDCWHDPTNHNLLPFEVAIVIAATLPAFIATGLSMALRRTIHAA